MIVFDKNLLENTFLAAEAKKLNEQNFIPKSQLAEINGQLPTLRSQHNILIRIGFFVLGCLLLFSISGVIALVTLGVSSDTFWISTLVNALIAFAGSELLARNFQQFGYGLDDAFILGFQGLICATFGMAFNSPMAAFLALALIGILGCIRYIHTASLLFGLIGTTAAICYAVIELKVMASAFLPFVLFVFAGALYFIYQNLKNSSKFIYYANAIGLLQAFSLLIGYLSMNYLVVRELSEILLGIEVLPGKDIPFAFLFYGFTFLIPAFYIAYGLYSKDRLMLIIGILAFAFSIYTIRFYYHVMPVEWALILGGMVLFAATYFTIFKLKNKETGITFKPARGSDPDLLPNFEALIVNSQVDVKPMENQSKMPFGGGGFSGGGSGGDF